MTPYLSSATHTHKKATHAPTIIWLRVRGLGALVTQDTHTTPTHAQAIIITH